MFFLKKLSLISAVLGFFIYSGCGKAAGPEDFDALDGNAGFVASEVSAMDAAALDFNAIGAPKEFLGKAAAETIGVEVVINRWAYDSTLKAWTRSASATYPSGERVRYDTVWFYDANGQFVEQRPTLALVDSVYHVRSVTQSRNGNEVKNRLEMRIRVTKTATDTFAVKNGDIKGTYNGDPFRTCTVTNVTRYRENGVWQFPDSGSISIDRVLRTIDIVFTGNGHATATVIRKRDGRTIVINVTVASGEES